MCAGLQVMLVAGDTFRAAATEQLGEWARRSGSQLEAADPARIASGAARPDKVLSQVWAYSGHTLPHLVVMASGCASETWPWLHG